MLDTNYDTILFSMSGGKDSLACILHLIELGFPINKMELWHQSIDGKGQKTGLMDWPITEAYVEACSKHLGIPAYFQWREGGFEREMMRADEPTAPVSFQTTDGNVVTLTRPEFTKKGEAVALKKGTRLQFPQVSGDLSVRWCSSYLKIDVASRVINNDPRFVGSRTLYITGERRQESVQRSKYNEREPHRCHSKKRHVDHWRPILDWTEDQVWEIIRRWNIRPHAAYFLGFGRVSCMKCIFGMYDQWATIQELDPSGFELVAEYEALFGKTIKRGMSIREQAARGKSTLPRGPEREVYRNLALGHAYPQELITTGDDWTLPVGAFKHTGGPV